jgi:hypothetical protein
MSMQRYDIAIGDITIRYNRMMYVNFTIPYTESGVAMIVPVKEKVNNNMWIFLKQRNVVWKHNVLYIYWNCCLAVRDTKWQWISKWSLFTQIPWDSDVFLHIRRELSKTLKQYTFSLVLFIYKFQTTMAAIDKNCLIYNFFKKNSIYCFTN